ncbi:oxidoreductase [Mucilaginibacter sp. PPCGB 2223]|uniref:Gfo/Idh/MocA family protein n=1 Tax=Mucilaginibacter sp. PPCGB 2223 TaxID=1886027 RepID=UPI000825DA15|nr:Gfo/Idh/MocA family oxidoreductase [Mucilaginibacter sp. PPCGB 2223]OCX51457.1 oxidoreductase [Mucilaginibacter sp. PPCGB 2223]
MKEDNKLPLQGAGGLITWGIIGCGDVTEKKSGPAFNKVPNSKLIAVMRRDAGKAADYASRHGVSKWYSNADELMDDPEINSVYIATPPLNHKDYAIDALKRGLNVYIEKPVTLNRAEAEDIAVALKQSTAKLTVAHYRRAVPMFLFVKDLLDKKAIGDVRTVQIRMWQSRKPNLITQTKDNWRVNPAVSGGGYFHDLAPHQLDLMLYFFGVPEKMYGFSLNQSKNTTADDHVAGLALFPNSVVLNGSWSFNVDENEEIDECMIVGSEGSISFPFFGKTVVWHNEDEEEVQVVDFDHPEHIQQPMIERMVQYFRGEAENLCSIKDAIIVMKMIDTFTGK